MGIHVSLFRTPLLYADVQQFTIPECASWWTDTITILDRILTHTTYLSTKSAGGPPCLVRGPSGAVQIGIGIFVLP